MKRDEFVHNLTDCVGLVGEKCCKDILGKGLLDIFLRIIIQRFKFFDNNDNKIIS